METSVGFSAKHHKESEAIKEDIDAAQESEQTTEEPEKAAEK